MIATIPSSAAPGSFPIEQTLAKELQVKPHQIWSAIRLLDSGATVPFIARYRKEATGGLSDNHLRQLSERLDYLRELDSRRKAILESIESQNKLSPAIKDALEKAETKAQLEDLYLPFKPKRHSKAQAARDCGLEPLALKILDDPHANPLEEAKNYVCQIKDIVSVEQALAGAKEILAEKFSEAPALIHTLREKFWKEGWVYSQVASKEKGLMPDSQKFRDYFDFREAMTKIPSHRILAILRGRAENILTVHLETTGLLGYTDAKTDEGEYIHEILKTFSIVLAKTPRDFFLLETVKYTWRYKIRMALEIDLILRLKKAAEEEAIRVFAANLKNLLLAAPAGGRSTMGLDPGFRTGVKVACIDKTGQVTECATIYPHTPNDDWTGSLKTLKNLAQKHSIELIAIGNGTASRETERLVQDLLKTCPEMKLQKIMVSEAGASVYSACELASVELPSLDVTLRGAVSIARRLQDPLAELVKIEPKAIGVGQYQHDVNQVRLDKMLRNVVEDCVNAVGVDVNIASPSLLSYVAGLTKRTAEKIVAFRNQNGAFKTREDLKKIFELGPRTFEQAAGFLRISNGINPLDRSGVHPESYPVVQKILERQKTNLSNLLGNSGLIRSLDPRDFADDQFGVPTVTDILEELEKPGRDPRPEFKAAALSAAITELQHLKPGMILEGTVTNVANFGAFVDLGVHQDGLIHISQLSHDYVSDPHSVVKTGQIVTVKVLEIDIPRRRISLSLRLQERR